MPNVWPMNKAYVFDANDIKEMLAEKYNVPVKNVIKSQYSYTVVLEEINEDNEEDVT